MRISIHQPNFFCHFGLIYKISMSDIFICLSQVQFEKNGYQNRYFLQGLNKWVTKPVNHGLEPIFTKEYVGGTKLLDLNLRILKIFLDILDIKTQVVIDIPTASKSTQRLLDNLNHYGATAYITNPSAKDKYLDEDMIRKAGIDIIYSSHPEEKLNILEMFEKYGIEGTKNQLWKSKKEIVKSEKDN